MFDDGLDMHDQLKIPFAGSRSADDASVYTMGFYAYLWSSSPYSDSNPISRYLNVEVGNLFMDDNIRANAYSVRCFYDFYQPFTQSFTLSFEVSDGNGSTSAST